MQKSLFFAPAKVIADTIKAAYFEEVSTSPYVVIDTTGLAARLDAVAKWATDANGTKPGLLLHSEKPGTGKTTMARALFLVAGNFPGAVEYYLRTATKDLRAAINELLPNCTGPDDSIARDYYQKEREAARPLWDKLCTIDDEARDAWLGYRCNYYGAAFFPARELAIKAQNGGREALLDAENAPAKMPLLFIDDLGDEPRSVRHHGKTAAGDFRSEEIMPLVELLLYRYEHRLPVIITTNLGPGGIANFYGPRIADRLREMCVFGNFAGESYRK